MWWVPQEKPIYSVITGLAKLGLDPFSPEFSVKYLAAKFNSSRRSIKAALLDQTIIAGIGNIYADEALWRARVNPEMLTSQMSRKLIERVINSSIDVMSEAVLQGGTSFDDLYINVDGKSGFFAQSLAAYGKTNSPCFRCGTPIARIIVGQRSSHFCPRCQRKKR